MSISKDTAVANQSRVPKTNTSETCAFSKLDMGVLYIYIYETV